MIKRKWPYVALALVVAEILLMIVSWVWSAAMPFSGVRSLLSGEGVRWLVGQMPAMLARKELAWLLLLTMAWGTVQRSGIITRRLTYRASRARWMTAIYVAIYLGVCVVLTCVPHAVLLSATGSLWPSPFSASVVPLLALGMLTAALLYGTVAGTMQTLSDFFDSLTDGISTAAPLLVLYLVTAQFCLSLWFVLN